MISPSTPLTIIYAAPLAAQGQPDTAPLYPDVDADAAHVILLFIDAPLVAPP